jgi:hypothetical protein
MGSVQADICLRPLRIGLVADPNNMEDVRKVMRASVTVWGGQFNPIIPAAGKIPPIWRDKLHRAMTSPQIAQGYARFFEPDVYIEAKAGLVTKMGLMPIAEKWSIERVAVRADKFLAPEMARSYGEPSFGLSMNEVLTDAYHTEARFNLKTPRKAILVAPDRKTALAEAMFGVFPTGKAISYFRENYDEVFQPEEMELGFAAWQAWFDGATTPLAATRHELTLARTWRDEPTVFVFDPNSAPDLVDLWNLRCEPAPIIPLPVDWLPNALPKIAGLLKAAHKPLEGNPHGIMRKGVVEFSRSLSNAQQTSAIELIASQMGGATFSAKRWRTDVWSDRQESAFGPPRPARLEVYLERTKANFDFDVVPESVSMPSLSPKFAHQYARANPRWANVLKISAYGRREVATTLPFNILDQKWPRLSIMPSQRTLVTSEGWVYLQQWKDWPNSVQLMGMSEAITSFLKHAGLDPTPSDPGLIGDQILERLGGLIGTYILKSLPLLTLLNDIAARRRRRSNDVEEVEDEFPGRSVAIPKLIEALQRGKTSFGRMTSIDDLTGKGILRLGLESTCDHCRKINWHGLDEVGYTVTCERCLKVYPYPQGKLDKNNANFRYRVVGPFAVPDFAQGAYSSLLSLKTLAGVSFHDGLTHSPGVKVTLDGKEFEIDFVGFWSPGGLSNVTNPTLVFGESKSFGKDDLFKQRDYDRLKAIGARFPGSVLVISVMRDWLTPKEIAQISKLAVWGRRPMRSGEISNPVVVLTGRELFADEPLQHAWKEAGAPFDKLQDHAFRDLREFAQATQIAYLGLNSFFAFTQSTKAKKPPASDADANR